jgi:N-acyl-D-aspartate/D-glutamate deacylase
VSPHHPEYIGKSVKEIAGLEGKDPYDVIFDLIVEEKRSAVMIINVMDEDDIRRILKHPVTMIGTDAFPKFGEGRVHPRFLGTYPRILGRYVREYGVLTLEEAIRKMTSLPAQTFGVKGKGFLKEGFDADITIFDPETILDRASFEDPSRPPVGIHYAIVNGAIAVHDGEVTGTDAGRVLGIDSR